MPSPTPLPYPSTPDSLTFIMSLALPSTPLTAAHIDLLQRHASTAAHHAYAPYSNFRVGAALLLSAPPTAHAAIVSGCNVENASYRLTSCAEQNAIAAAVALHGPGIRIRAIAIANLNGAPCQPCGACRQTILEFSTPDTVVIFPTVGGSSTQTTIAELLPAGFVLPHDQK